MKDAFKSGIGGTGRRIGRTGSLVLAWCRGHILLVTMFLFFPLTVAGFYWGSPPAGENPLPNYLVEEEQIGEEIQAVLPQQNDEQLAGESAEMLPSPGEFQAFEDMAPSPLGDVSLPQPEPFPEDIGGRCPPTIEADPPQEEVSPSGGPSFPVASPLPAEGLMECVWLTGMIENVPNENPQVPQQAARVHVFTPPARN